ncbi:MAG: hypothetical protein JOZ22_24170 [Acidobacteriia bacterium]|nr:hypothetical protein [Terriglobia bacterium]MBV9746234.1 hypothetical protein [Terriglobia bacterium]
MAQDPEHDEDEHEPEQVLTSHALDLVPLYDSSTVDAELEADVIRGVLDSNGIATLIQRGGPFPLYFQVLVPRGKVLEAQRLLAEARAAGPEAAAEAERATEES